MFEKYGKPPQVDGYDFNPKIKCNEMSGYHLTSTEVRCVSALINFMTRMKDELRGVDLEKTLRRLENSTPIDDASLVSPGDAIISLGDHTTNPLEDMISMAKIWTLMSWMITNAEDDFNKIMAQGREKAEKDMLEFAESSERRRKHFARNIKGNMRLGGGSHSLDSEHEPDDCPICQFREANDGREPTPSEAVDMLKKLLDASEDLERIREGMGMKSGREARGQKQANVSNEQAEMDQQIKDMLNQMEKNLKDNPNDIN
jgi:hypothetical protein